MTIRSAENKPNVYQSFDSKNRKRLLYEILKALVTSSVPVICLGSEYFTCRCIATIPKAKEMNVLEITSTCVRKKNRWCEVGFVPENISHVVK